MDIRIFFEYKNEVVQLPVNPEKLGFITDGTNKQVEIINLGEVSILKDIKLKTLVINAFFPRYNDYPFILTKGKFEDPDFYIEFFNKIRKDKEPCQLVISGLKMTLLVSIERFYYSIDSGSEDIYYSLELKEYKKYAARSVSISDNNTKIAIDSQETRPKTKFAIGDKVLASGKYYSTADGELLLGNLSNFNGKITHVKQEKTFIFRYYLIGIDGIHKGWVSESQLKHI